MQPGETVLLRATEQHVKVLAVLDGAGTLLVQPEGEEPFQAARDDVEHVWAKHKGCGCCG